MAQEKLLLVLGLMLSFSFNTKAEERFEFKKEDMEFAKNAGMTAVLLENEHSTDLEKSLCDFSIKTLTELSNLIK